MPVHRLLTLSRSPFHSLAFHSPITKSDAAQALAQIIAGSDVADADAPVFAAHASVRAVKSAWQSSGFEKIAQRYGVVGRRVGGAWPWRWRWRWRF